MSKEMSLTRVLTVAWLLVLSGSAGMTVLASFSTGGNGYAETGDVWSRQEHGLNSTDLRFKDVEFVNSTHGWIVGEDRTGTYGGVILSTSDAGNSWHLSLNNSAPYHERMCIVDRQAIWVTGESALFYSFDLGRTWNKSVVVDVESGMSTVEFFNRTHGWTATMGTLYRTTDGGESWQEVPGWSFSGDVPIEMHFSSATEAWAIGFFGIYYSKDGGDVWDRQFNRGGWALSFVDAAEAWAVGESLLVHMTDDYTWTEEPLPRRSPIPALGSPYLTDVMFWDASNGWIVGGSPSDAHVLYTPNGGSDWYEQESPAGPTERLMAIDLVNMTHGWAVGYDGIIIRTTQATSLGSRLWIGMTDPVFATNALVGLVTVALLATGVLLGRRHYRRRKPDASSQG